MYALIVILQVKHVGKSTDGGGKESTKKLLKYLVHKHKYAKITSSPFFVIGFLFG